MNDKTKILYDQLTKDGYDVGDYNSFSNNVKDDNKRKNLYNAITKDGYDVGDYDTFSTKLVGNTNQPETFSQNPKVRQRIVEKKPDFFKSKGDNFSTIPFGGGNIEDVHDIAQEEQQRISLAEKAANDPYMQRQEIEHVFKPKNEEQISAVNKMIADARQQRAKERAENTRSVKSDGLFSTLSQAYVAGEQNDTDKQLEYASSLMEEAQNITNEAKKKGKTNFFAGYARAFKDSPLDAWSMGLQDLKNYSAAKKVLDKVDKGEQLNPAEDALMQALVTNAATKMYYSGDLGRGYKAGRVTAESLPFMLDMIVGMGTIQAATKPAAKALYKYALKKIGKDGLGNMSKKAVRGAVRTISGLGDVAAHTATFGGARVAADYQRRGMGDIQVSPNTDGTVSYAGRDNVQTGAEAIAKSVISTAAETGTELLGEYFAPMLGWVGKVTGANKIGKIIPASVGKAYSNIVNSQGFKNIQELAQRAKIADPIGEYGEEVVNNLISTAIGDMTPEELVDLDQNIDTFLGVAPMSVLFGAAGTGGYLREKYKNYRDMRTFENQMQETMGEDWSGVKEALQDADIETARDMVKDVLSSDMQPDMKKKAINYISSVLQEQTLQEVDKQQMPEQIAQAKQGIIANMQKSKDTLIKKGMSENEISTALNDTFNLSPEEMEGKYGVDMTNDIYNYRNAYTNYANYNYWVQNKAYEAREEAESQVEKMTNATTGTVMRVNSGLSKNPVNVLRGNIVFDNDGNVDQNQSDNTIYYLADDGKVKMAPISMFQSLVDDTPADELAYQAGEDAEQKFIQNEEAQIMQPEQSVQPIELETTFQKDGVTYVVSQKSPDGYVVSALDEEGKPVQSKLLTEEQIRTAMTPAIQEEQTSQEQFVQNEDVTQPEQQQVQTEPQTAISRIPVNENGEHDFESAPYQDTSSALIEISDNVDDAKDTAQQMIDNYNNELKKAEKAKTTGRSIQEIVRLKQEKKANIQAINEKIAYWNNVASRIESQRPGGIIAQAEEEAKANQQRLDSMTQEQQKEAQQEVQKKIDSGAYEKKQPRKRVRYVKEDSDMGEAVTPLEHVLREIATGRVTFNWNDSDTTQGLGSHLGLSSSPEERKKVIWALSSDGMTPEAAAEQIHADMPENLQGMVTDQDIFNMILNSFQEYGSPSKMWEAAKNMHGTDIEENIPGYNEDMERRQLEWEAGWNGMTVAEWIDYCDYIEDKLNNIYSSVSDEDLNTIFEKFYQQIELEHESRGNETESAGSTEGRTNSEQGNELLPESRSDNEGTDATGNEQQEPANQTDGEGGSVVSEPGSEVTREKETYDGALNNGNDSVSSQNNLNDREHEQGEVAGVSGESGSRNGKNEAEASLRRAGDRTTAADGQISWTKDTLLRDVVQRNKGHQTWIEDIQSITSGTRIGLGGENDVYLSRDGKSVIKINDFSYLPENSTNFDSFMNRVDAHNELFPNDAITILGFTLNSDGKVSVVLSQPYIGNAREATQEEIDNFLEEMGFYTDMSGNWTDGTFDIADTKPNNILVDEYGNMHFIDVLPYDSRKPGKMLEIPAKRNAFVAPDIKNGEDMLDYIHRVVKAKEINDAERETDINPTEAQKEAGNYKMGHVKVDGMDITIENPKGSVRSGKDANGNEWSVTMNNDYGYIRGTEGVDGDHIDVFLSDDPTEGNVYVVDQVNPDGSFDEHKVMYGFNSADEARNAYLSNYEEGWQGLGTITKVSKDEFKKWIESSHRKTKPFAEYKSVKEDNNNIRFRETNNEVSVFAQKHNLNEKDVQDYADYMRQGNLNGASRAFHDIRRKIRIDNKGVSLGQFAKIFSPIRKELYEKFGNIDEMSEQYVQRELEERSVMESARKRAEEAAEAERRRLQEFHDMSDEQLDDEYMKAVEANDENRMRDLVNEAARRNGYGDVGSEYQGVGAWAAPGNPRYESDEERRAALETDGNNVNVVDMVQGYTPQPEDYFTNLHAYGNDTPQGRESAEAINKAMDEARKGNDPMIKVYRAVPKSVKEGKLRNGDWVTPSRKYAEMHGNNRLEGDYRIIEQEVPASQLWWDGNDINEWGFDDGKNYAYRNTRNNRKMNDLITRDDNGNIIPLSQRFNARKSDVRFRFIGEQGAARLDAAEEATTRLDNLATARRMEQAYIDKKARIEKLRDSEPVEITGNEIEPSDDLKQYKKNALEYGKKLQGSYVNKDTDRTIQLQRGRKNGGLKEVLQHDLNDVAHIKSVAAIPQIIENSIYIDSADNHDTKKNPNVSKYHYYVCGLKIGGVDYTVRMVEAEDKDGNRYYDHKLTHIEKGNLIDNNETAFVQTSPTELSSTPGTGAEERNRPTNRGEIQAAPISKSKDRVLISLLQTNERENARKIKIATGWERGADGKWRYETPDFEYYPNGDARQDDKYKESDWYKELYALEDKLFDGETLTDEEQKRFDELAERENEIRDNEKNTDRVYLDDYVKDDELFKAYPELKQTRVDFVDIPNAEYSAKYNEQENRITVNTAKSMDNKSVLAHEIQHAIQRIEGFANGSNTDNYRNMPTSENVISDIVTATDGRLLEDGGVDNTPQGIFDALNRKTTYGTILRDYNYELDTVAQKYGYDNIFDLVNDIDKFKSSVQMYLSESGEVEARNVQTRLYMSPEERRQSLAEETEDVAREDQTFLQDALGTSESRANEDIDAAVSDIAGKLNIGVRVAHSIDEVNNDSARRAIEQGRRIQGFYDTRTGEIVVYAPNAVDAEDAIRTVLHEGVAHYGLRRLVGEERMDDFLDDIFTNASKEVRQRIIDTLPKYGYNSRIATEEYMARMAEKGVDDVSFWDRIKQAFKNLLRRIGININVNDNELRYILWRSRQNLNMERPLDMAKDVAMQYNMGVGNYFREVDQTPEQSIIDAWDNIASSTMFSLRESAVDYLTAIDKFQDLISKRTGEEIKSFENAYDSMTFLSSKNRVEMDWYDSNIVTPMRKAILELVGKQKGRKWDWNKGELRKLVMYVEAKHGAERNRQMAIEKYIKELKPESLKFFENAGISIDRDKYKEDLKKTKKEAGKKAYDKSFQSIYDKLINEGLQKEEAESQAKKRAKVIADRAESNASEKFRNDFRDKLMKEYSEKVMSDWNDTKKRISKQKDISWIEKQRELDREASRIGADLSQDYSGLSSVFGDEKEYPDGWYESSLNFVEEYENNHNETSIGDLWKSISQATDYTLNKQYESGLVSKEYVDRQKQRFENYIPLRGFQDEIAGDVYNYIGNDFYPGSNPVKSAKGRTSEPGNPFGSILNTGYSTISVGNKNLAKMSLYSLVNNHDTEGLAVSNRAWMVRYDKLMQDDDLMEALVIPSLEAGEDIPEWVEAVPKYPEGDISSEEVSRILGRFEDLMKKNSKEGYAKPISKRSRIAYRTLYKERSEHEIPLYILGDKYVITITGNPRVAQAMNGLLNPNVNNKGWAEIGERMQRFMAGAFTAKNAAFSIANLTKDSMYANNQVFIKENIPYWIKFTKKQKAGFGDFIPMMMRLKKYRDGNLDLSDETNKMFKEFMDNGGATGYTFVDTQEKYAKELADKLKELSKSKFKVADPRKLITAFFDSVEFTGQAAELVNRFAAYQTSRDMGRSVTRSIRDAKEITVNFNRKGAGMKSWDDKKSLFDVTNMAAFFSQYGRAYILFWNANMQAKYRFYKNIKEHPIKTFTTLIGSSMMFASVLVPFMNNFVLPALYEMFGIGSGDDDEDYYNTLTDWERTHNICIRLPYGNWLKIPLSPEMSPWYTIGDCIGGAIAGQRELSASDFIKSGIDAISPLPINWSYEGANVILNVLPTISQPVAQVAMNVNFMGNPIKKQPFTMRQGFAPQYTMVYGNTSPALIELSRLSNKLTGGTDSKTSGRLDWNPAFLQNVITGYTGGYGSTFLSAADWIVSTLKGEEQSSTIGKMPLVSRFFISGNKDVKIRRINSSFYDVIKFTEEFKFDQKSLENQMNNSLKEGNKEEYMKSKKQLEELLKSDRAKKYIQLDNIVNSTKDFEKYLKEMPDDETTQGMLYQLKSKGLEILKK